MEVTPIDNPARPAPHPKRPFGYDHAPDGDIVRLVANAAEQAKVRRMKVLRKKGASLREIGAATGVPFRSVQRILERANR